MSRHEVYEMLKEHYKKTGQIMTPVQMILAAGEETEPAPIIDAVHKFSSYVDGWRRDSIRPIQVFNRCGSLKLKEHGSNK